MTELQGGIVIGLLIGIWFAINCLIFVVIRKR